MWRPKDGEGYWCWCRGFGDPYVKWRKFETGSVVSNFDLYAKNCFETKQEAEKHKNACLNRIEAQAQKMSIQGVLKK